MPESGNHKTQRSTTSAKRLHTLLMQLYNWPGTNLSDGLVQFLKTSELDAPTGWPEVRCQQIVAEMIESLRDELSRAHFDADEMKLYGSSLEPICKALTPARLWRPVAETWQIITPVVLNNLEHTDLILRKQVQETELAEANFETLLLAIKDAQTALFESSLPSELKRFLLGLLIKVQLAVTEYKFRGVEGVEEALAGFYGGLGMGRTQIAEHLDEPQKSKLASVLERGQQIVTLAHNVASFWPQLEAGAHNVQKFLDRF